MRRFTKFESYAKKLFPISVGPLVVLPLTILATRFHPTATAIGLWIVVVLWFAVGLFATLRAQKRYREIEAEAEARGGGDVLMFTELDVNEIALIKGRMFARGLRLLSSANRSQYVH